MQKQQNEINILQNINTSISQPIQQNSPNNKDNKNKKFHQEVKCSKNMKQGNKNKNKKQSEKDQKTDLDEYINQLVKQSIQQNLAEISQKLVNDIMDDLKRQNNVKSCQVNSQVHTYVRCDGCEICPIIGIRYKCRDCDDFDFCSQCEEILPHQHDHVFLKIRRPIPIDHLGQEFALQSAHSNEIVVDIHLPMVKQLVQNSIADFFGSNNNLSAFDMRDLKLISQMPSQKITTLMSHIESELNIQNTSKLFQSSECVTLKLNDNHHCNNFYLIEEAQIPVLQAKQFAMIKVKIAFPKKPGHYKAKLSFLCKGQKTSNKDIIYINFEVITAEQSEPESKKKEAEENDIQLSMQNVQILADNQGGSQSLQDYMKIFKTQSNIQIEDLD